jgi:hypothetical protein
MARRRGEDKIPPQLAEALAGIDPGAARDIAGVIALHREFPAWAVWLPDVGRQWIAVRPASWRAPSSDRPTIWVEARTAAALADRMRAVDAQLAPPPPATDAAGRPASPQEHGSAAE